MQDKNDKLDISKKRETEKKIRGIPSIMKELNSGMEIEQQFSGPLPLEVLQNLTSEQRDKLVNSFVNQETREHEANMKTLELISNKNNQSYNLQKLSLFLGIPGFLILIAICLFTNNKDILLDIIKIFVGFIGGIGFGKIINKNTEN